MTATPAGRRKLPARVSAGASSGPADNNRDAYFEGYDAELARLKEAAREPEVWAGHPATWKQRAFLHSLLESLGWSWEAAAASLRELYPKRIPSDGLEQATSDEASAMIGLLLKRGADGPRCGKILGNGNACRNRRPMGEDFCSQHQPRV